jgi:hypothetical protein
MENNFRLSGDEARFLMTLILSSENEIPVKESFQIVNLFTRLNDINLVQPRNEEDENAS